MSSEYKSYVDRLNWYKENAGSKYYKKIEPFKGIYPLVSPAKGIYKPKDIRYVLSITITESEKYDDGNAFNILGNGKAFFYELERSKNDSYSYSNAALIDNINDSVPVGVVKKMKQRSDSEYIVEGCFYPIIIFPDRALLCDKITFNQYSKQEIINSCFKESKKLGLLGRLVE